MGEQKQNQPAGQVIINAPKPNKLLKKPHLIILIVVLVIIAASIIYYFVTCPPQLSITDLNSRVNSYIFQNKYQDAVNLINDQGTSTRNTEQVQYLLASVYMNMNKPQAALTVYQHIAKLYGWTASLYADAGQAANAAKNYSGALGYYQQAQKLASSDKKDISALQDTPYYQTMIKQLQQKVTTK